MQERESAVCVLTKLLSQ